MFRQTRRKRINVLLIFGECWKNFRNTARVYYAKHSDRHHLCQQYFPFVETKWRAEKDYVKSDNNYFIISKDTDIDVSGCIQADRTLTVSENSHELQIGSELVRA